MPEDPARPKAPRPLGGGAADATDATDAGSVGVGGLMSLDLTARGGAVGETENGGRTVGNDAGE